MRARTSSHTTPLVDGPGHKVQYQCVFGQIPLAVNESITRCMVADIDGWLTSK
jgi:hypothetical protein